VDSILTSVKKLLGIEEEYEHFDQVIVMHINSVLLSLNQIGVGPTEGFTITDKTAVWNDFIPEGTTTVKMDAVKTYIGLKVRLLFDPPNNSALIEAMNRSIAELEWRLNIAAESVAPNGEEAIQNG
jgi:hypothetical protein